MSDVTRILEQIEQGDHAAAERLWPLVYDELRQLAAARMANERSDHTLQATALVHEAYVRLVDTDRVKAWDSRGHFFAAAGEAMRRILVERARAKQQQKRGGGLNRVGVGDIDRADDADPELVLAVSEALEQLAAEDERFAALVKLRYFTGFSLPEAAEALGISRSTAYEYWSYAKSRLRILLDRSTEI